MALESETQSTQSEQQRKQDIVAHCLERGQMVDAEALAALAAERHWKDIIARIPGHFISGAKVSEFIARHETKLSEVKTEAIVKKGGRTGLAKDSGPDFKVMHELEATGKSASEGKLPDFLAYFRDKHEFLSTLMRHRAGFSPKTVERLKEAKKYDKIDLIGMVTKRWVSKAGNTTMEMDTPEGRFIAIASKENAALTRDAERILADDVLGIKGKKFTDDMVLIDSFVWPDLAHRQPRASERDLSVCLISDIHVGSRLFMEKEFARFLSWLNADSLPEREAERAGKIKYLVIAGDNVDGVGVYPDQFDELAIRDIFGQYDRLSELIAQVPEHIEIFICPGQHDAVRRADPQPAIPKEYARGLSELGNVHLVGSPSWVEIEGMKCLIYHGGSFHDMYSATKHLLATEPEKAMIELLRRRDLSTGFGLNQPYVPERRDIMVIREEPDYYFGGDMHHKGHATYRGCTVANAGCWQERTMFQVREGHVPTPGIAIDINLRTRRLTESSFAEAK